MIRTVALLSLSNVLGSSASIFYAEDGTAIMTAETIEHVAQL